MRQLWCRTGIVRVIVRVVDVVLLTALRLTFRRCVTLFIYRDVEGVLIFIGAFRRTRLSNYVDAIISGYPEQACQVIGTVRVKEVDRVVRDCEF